ncbi:hypothetical protein AX16_009054 [Volvariella volvacea WC 439]|nr:hypothetical protein AX16_009054 [Volvariella volvacea WC 439]
MSSAETYSSFNDSTIDNTGGRMTNNIGSHNTVNGDDYRGMGVSGDYHNNSYYGRASDRRIYNDGGTNQINMDNSRGNMYTGRAAPRNEVDMDLLEQVQDLNRELDEANEEIDRLVGIIKEYERRYGKLQLRPRTRGY